MSERPVVAVLGGINGAGKTTASQHLLRDALKIPVFVNADTIARGLNAFNVESEAVKAGRIMLDHLHELAEKKRSFAFESTLSGRAYSNWLASLRILGYEVHIFYYWLESAAVSIKRVAQRVASGGHHVPTATIHRRYRLSVQNFLELYRPIADQWRVYDNTHGEPKLLACGIDGREHVLEPDRWDDLERSAGNEADTFSG